MNGKTLHPSYTVDSLQWMIDTLQMNPARGMLRKVMVSNDEGVMGWYIYYLREGVTAEVAQIAAPDSAIDDVFRHLLWQADRDGAIAVTGQVEPATFDTLGEHSCLMRNPNNRWLLLHSKDRALRSVIDSGEAFFSRLDTEWWISELLR